jgi:hypothetical protein
VDVLDQRAMEQRMSCGTTAMASPGSAITCGVLAIDQDAARLDVVEALHQGEDGGHRRQASTSPTRCPVPISKLRFSKIVGQSG